MFTSLSKRLLLLLPLVLFVPGAEAIVVTCPNGFNQCDPYSGNCYTAWTATLAGQVQTQCSTDPSSCRISSLTSGACADPATPPVNPNAVRVCPPLASCFVDFSAFHARGYAASWQTPPIPANWLGNPGEVKRCWSPDHVSPDRFELDAVSCMANVWRSFPGFTIGNWPAFEADMYAAGVFYLEETAPGVFVGFMRSYQVVVEPGVTFEPIGNACTWNIQPALGANPCALPQALLIANMKDSTTYVDGLISYYDRLERRIAVKRWALSQGLYGSMASTRFRVNVSRLVWLMDLHDLIANLLVDPPNPVYASLPPQGVYPPLDMPPADATFTQAQIDANTAWLTKLRKVSLRGKQLTDTFDNLGGAILAAEAQTPGAAAWVRRLALHADFVAAEMAARGMEEIALRAAVVSAGPSVSQPAGCLTPTDAANAMQEGVLQGNSLYHAHLRYDGLLGACGEAVNDPAWLEADASEDSAMWAGLSTAGIADWLCTHGGYCTALTVTPSPVAFGSVAVNSTSPLQTVTIRNDGTAAVFLGTLSLTGAFPEQYKHVASLDLCSGQTLTPGQTCTLGLRFKPLTTGELPARLKIPITPVLKIDLSGTGV